MEKPKKSYRYKYHILSVIFFLMFAYGMEYNRSFWTWLCLMNSGMFIVLYFADKDNLMFVEQIANLKAELKFFNGARKHMEENIEAFESAKLKRIMNNLLEEKEEIIGTNGLRFSGTHEEKIKQVFKKHGVIYEPPF